MSDNIENVEPNAGLNNSNADGNNCYIRKISAQAETDEKPIGRVADMHRFLLDFEKKNKAEAKKHYFPHKKAAAGSRPWEKKKVEVQVEQAKEVSEDIVEEEEAAVNTEEEEEEKLAVEDVEDNISIETKKDQEAVADGDIDDDASLDDFASIVASTEQVTKESESGAPSSNHNDVNEGDNKTTTDQYTRFLSKQAEADERPLESVSELKQWLMKPGADQKNKTLAATAAAERERAERKLINELSKRMTREEAVKTARSYLRHISDQAVCEELPLMHVSEAQQFLMDFERRNREHFEKHSIKHPNKKLGRTSGAAAAAAKLEDKLEEEESVEPIDEVKEDEKLGEDESSEVEISTIVEASIASTSDEEKEEKEGPIDHDESASLDLSIDGLDEEEEEVEVKMEQPSIDEGAKQDSILEETVKDFTTTTTTTTNVQESKVDGGNVDLLEDAASQAGSITQKGFVITYEQSTRSLISASTASSSEQHQPKTAADASDVFRKRYLVDVNQKDDVEEAERPKKLRRGLDLLKCLACPNPVKVVLNGGGGSNAPVHGDKDAKKMMPKNPTVTMTSSADHDDILASRRNLGAAAVAAGGYEALESPSNSEITFDNMSTANMSANGIYGIKKPTSTYNSTAQFHAGAAITGTGSPANTTLSGSSGSSDGLPKTNMLAKAGIKPGDGMGRDHLGWLENQFQGGELYEC